jgi:hypothetical protein
MRHLLAAICLALAALAGSAARASVPLFLAERQIVVLELDRPVARLAVTDPEVVSLQADGKRVKVTAVRDGRTLVEVAFDDGVTVAYDVVVDPAKRAAAHAPAAQNEIAIAVGEERRVAAPALARAMLEENGVARVRVEGQAMYVLGISPGTASLVAVDAQGARATYTVHVR